MKPTWVILLVASCIAARLASGHYNAAQRQPTRGQFQQIYQPATKHHYQSYEYHPQQQQQQQHYHQYPQIQEEAHEEEDERPRIRLGLRVRIPAFKFDLPRVNLPKVTIQAKFQQPNTPRTIRLPAINLDTSSKVSSSSNSFSFGDSSRDSDAMSRHHGQAYHANRPSYSQKLPSQADYSTQTFSFSTSQEDSGQLQQVYNHAARQPMAYSATQVFPLYASQNNSGPTYNSDEQLGFERARRSKRHPNLIVDRLYSNEWNKFNH